MQNNISTVVQVAIETAIKGIKIFPFNPETKKPYPGFTNWQSRATTDLEQIRQWWIIWPEAMIAALTGAANGFFVFDVDAGFDEKTGKQKLGLESLHSLEQKHGKLPATMVVKTPNGGYHYYFRYPANGLIKNSTSTIAPDIDIRGDGGCIIWPGSIRPNGKYEIVSGGIQ